MSFIFSRFFALCLLVFPASLLAHPGATDKIHLLTENIAASPTSQYLYVQRSLAYSNDNQAQLAERDIVTAESLGDPIDAAFAHGILLYRSAQFDAARGYFDRYLMANPGHIPSLEYRARLLRDTGESAAALADFLQLFSLYANANPGHYLSAANLMRELPDYGDAGAIALLDQRMAVVGVTSQFQRYAIALEIERRNYDGAIARLATLDEKLRATPQWQLELAQVYLLADQPEQARQFLEAADEQLRQLRSNTARLELREEIAGLLAGLDSQD